MFCLMLIASLSADVRSFRIFVSTLEGGSHETEERAASIMDSSASADRASFEISRAGLSEKRE